jgi:hypothetical protein
LYAEDNKIFFLLSGDNYFVASWTWCFSQWCNDCSSIWESIRAWVLQDLVSRDIFIMNYQVTDWTVWTPFVILGLFLNQSLISLHIESLIVKASRMLSYIRWIGKVFRDPLKHCIIKYKSLEQRLTRTEKWEIEWKIKDFFQPNIENAKTTFCVAVCGIKLTSSVAQ